jgi:Spy/CpxP family protein refolding chaperone
VSATKTTIVAILVVLLTFTAGFMAGVFASHMMILRGGHGAPFFPMAMVNRLDRRLDLTDAQRAQVEEIVRRHHDRIDGLWNDLRPRVRAEVDAANVEISRVLTPEQRLKFDRLKFHLGGRGGSPKDRD